jgi:hypothetical protein
MGAHREIGSAVMRLRRGGALVTGRRCWQVHELHHTGVVLLGLHMGKIGAVSACSMVATMVRNIALACGGLPRRGGDGGGHEQVTHSLLYRRAWAATD